MAPKKVEVEFSNPWGDYDVGDRAELELLEAKKVVRSGYGVYATKAAAVDAEGDAGAEKTKRGVAKKATG